MSELKFFSCFDTYNDMITNDNLRNGMIIFVTGAELPCDGKAGFYRISSKLDETKTLRSGETCKCDKTLRAVKITLESESNVQAYVDEKMTSTDNIISILSQTLDNQNKAVIENDQEGVY